MPKKKTPDAVAPAAPDRTLAEAQAWLQSRLLGGVSCPCCGQHAKVYPRTITGSMAKTLVYLYRAYVHPLDTARVKVQPASDGGRSYVHMPSLLALAAADRKFLGSGARGGDFAKLKFWALIEPQTRAEAGNGYWRITDLGVAFATGEASVQKRAIVYNDELRELEGEQVRIRDVLDEKFEYEAVMAQGW